VKALAYLCLLPVCYAVWGLAAFVGILVAGLGYALDWLDDEKG
jgi:hypothetical protein